MVGPDEDVAWLSTPIPANATRVVIDKSFSDYRPRQCYDWFCGFNNSALTVIEGLANLNVSQAKDLSYMFYNSKFLTSLDLSSFETANVTNTAYMFANCSALKTIYATESFTTENVALGVADTHMFQNCSAPLTGGNGTKWADGAWDNKTYAGVDKSGRMGYFTAAPFAKFVFGTKNTVTFSADGTHPAGDYVFSLAEYAGRSPDANVKWNTVSVNAMTNAIIEASFFNFKPTHFAGLFKGMTKLKAIQDLKYLNVQSNVTDLRELFSNCEQLEELDLSIFRTHNVTNMYRMFSGCKSLKTVYAKVDFTTAKVKGTGGTYAFSDCTSIKGGNGTTLIETDAGKSATYARADLKSPDQKGYFTYRPTAELFTATGVLKFFCDGTTHGGNTIRTVGVSSWDDFKDKATSIAFDSSMVNYQPTSCESWFDGFSKVTSVTGLENLDVSKCVYFGYMFRDCAKLTELDLSGFDTTATLADMREFDEMFWGCSALTTIKASDKFKVAGSTSDMFQGCVKLEGPLGSEYDPSCVDGTYARIDGGEAKPGYFGRATEEAVAVWDGANTLSFYYDCGDHAGTAGKTYSLADDALRSVDAMPAWYVKCTSVTRIVIDDSFIGYQPPHCAKWFMNFKNVESIQGLRNLDVSAAADLRYMFYGCDKLKSLDLSHFDTGAVEYMQNMFGFCPNLAQIMASEDFLTSNLVKGTGDVDLFQGCTSLKGGKGTTLADVDASATYARLDEGVAKRGLFSYPAVAWLKDGVLTFRADGSVPYGAKEYEIDDTPGAVPTWQGDRLSVTKVVFDASFANYRPAHCHEWFWCFKNLTEVEGLKNLDTSLATSLHAMFSTCEKLTAVDLSHFDTANVTDMGYMFNGCKALTTLDLSSFSSAKLETMENMFSGCSALTAIYATKAFSSASLTETEKAKAAFPNCPNLKGGNGTTTASGNTALYARIDTESYPGLFTGAPVAVLSLDGKTLSFYADGEDHGGAKTYSVPASIAAGGDPLWLADCENTVTKVFFHKSFAAYKPTSCASWFKGFAVLTTLTNMEYLDVSAATSLSSMFMDCVSLKTLDLTFFDTAKVQIMFAMFKDCSALTTIYATDGFSTAAVTGGSSMFNGCAKLVGGAGTPLGDTLASQSSEYARLDGGPKSATPGYFTRLPAAYFYEDGGVYYLTFAAGDFVPGATRYLITETAATKPSWTEIAGWVQKVVFTDSFRESGYKPKHCYNWFSNFTDLTEIEHLDYLDLSEATDLAAMFYRCGKLTSVKGLGASGVTKVTNLGGMFYGCRSLTSLNLRSFDTAKVKSMKSMFEGCTGLSHITVSKSFTTETVLGTGGDSGTDMFKGCTGLKNFDSTKTDANYAKVGTAETFGYFSAEAVAIYDAAAKTLTFRCDGVETGGAVFSVSATESGIVPWAGIAAEEVIFDKSFAGYQPTTCANWFAGMTALEKITGLEYLDVSETVDLSNLFDGCTKLTMLDLSGFRTAKVEEMGDMFAHCTALTTIYATRDFVIGEGTETASMFEGCTQITGGRGTTYVAGQTRTMARVDGLDGKPGYFTAAPLAVYDDVSKTLTFVADGESHAADGDVYSVVAATELPVDKVPAWTDVGDEVAKVAIDPSFAAFQPKHCAGWFWYFEKLEQIAGLGCLDVSEATCLKQMFYKCEKLTELDLTGFDTKNVTDMAFLFSGCKALKTVYASEDFDTASVTVESGMFTGCSSLEGGEGTKCDGVHDLGKAYARIDGGTAQPGYFTEKVEKKTAHAVYADATKTLTFYYDSVDHSSEGKVYEIPAAATAPVWYTDGTVAKVEKTVFDVTFADFRPTACYSWFDGAKEMATIEGLENLNTSEVLRMDYMFLSCAKLVSLDLTDLNVAKVTSMEGMFANCTALTTLDVQSWSTPKVEKMKGMFRYCPLLKRIYAYDTFETTSVTDGGDEMFLGCSSILGGSGTTYDYPNVGVAYARVDGQDGKPGYFTKYDPLAVTFDPNGGALADPSESPKMVTVDEKVGTLPVATREGFVFNGWFTKKAEGTKVTEETVIEKPVTFHAQWTVVTYTISYNLYGGENAAGNPVSYTVEDAAITLLPATREGFTFDGWTPDNGVIPAGSTGNKAFTAKWAGVPTYTVTFDAQGGTCGETTRLVPQNAAVGTLPTATLAGQTLKGWDKSPSGGTPVTAATIVDADITYYAQWSSEPPPGPKVVKIDRLVAKTGLVYNGAEQDGFEPYDTRIVLKAGPDTAKDAGDYTATFGLPADTSEYDYRWADDDSKADSVEPWSIAKRDVEDSGVTFAEIPDQTHTGAEIKPPVKMTYAGVERTLGTDYTVDYSDNVEVGTAKATVTGIGNFTGTKGLSFRIVDVEPTVVSIATPTAVEGLVYTATEQTGVAYDERLAIHGGTAAAKGVAADDYSTTFALPEDTTTTKYRWADGHAGTRTVDWSIAPRPADDEAVVYTEIGDQFYTGAAIELVVAMSYGGQVCERGVDYTVEYANNVNVGTATVTVTGIGNYSSTKTIAFEIREVPAGSSVVTFDKTEGVFVTEATRSVENGTAVGALPITYSMTREFAGWYTAATGGEAVTAEAIVTSNVIFYAQWQDPPADSHYVLFQGNGGTLSEYVRFVEDGRPLGALPAVERTGYDLVGWFTEMTGGEPVKAETLVTDNRIVHAQWTETPTVLIPMDDSRIAYGEIPDQDYVAPVCEPEVTMTFEGAPCEKGVDYEVAYENNDRVGTASVALTGIGRFTGTRILNFKILPLQESAGAYMAYDLEEDLGVVLDEIDGVTTDYRAGDKVTVKIEGLAKGLKLAQNKTTSAWTLSGVPTETARFETQPMFARVAVTYKDKTKGTNGKAEKLCLLPLDIVEAEVRALAPTGLLNGLYEPIDITELWPEAADAATHPKEWTIKGWPTGILYNNTDKQKAWKGKVGGMSVERTVDPYEVYGVPTKAGTFAVTATHKHKLADGKTTVSELLQATLTVWADEEEKSYRYVDQVGVATTNVSLGANVKSVSGLPAGLKFANGAVNGTPSKAGVFAVSLTMNDKSKETFLWLVNRGANGGILSKIGWSVRDSAVAVMQGVVQGWDVEVPTGAKVTVTGLPSGLAFKQDSKTKLWAFGGTPTKAGNYVVTFKTVLNGETVTERVSIVVEANVWTGNWYGVQKDAYTESSLNAVVNVAANGTVKLTLVEGILKTTVKTTVSAKNLNNDGHTVTLNVTKGKDVLRTFTADFEAGTLKLGDTVVAELCETTVSVAADKSVRTYVLEEIADGETNAYAYVTATYDAKKGAFTLAGKLWDGTAVKGTAYPLDKTTADGGLYLSSVLISDKAKNAVYLELSDNGSRARVLENGDRIAIGKDGMTPWTDCYLAAELKGKTFASLVPEASSCVVLAEDGEVVIDGLTTKELGTKLAANGLAKLTLTDKFGWKWVCEMLPVDNDAKTQFRGIATGTKRGETTQYAPVWSK